MELYIIFPCVRDSLCAAFIDSSSHSWGLAIALDTFCKIFLDSRGQWPFLLSKHTFCRFQSSLVILGSGHCPGYYFLDSWHAVYLLYILGLGGYLLGPGITQVTFCKLQGLIVVPGIQALPRLPSVYLL